MSRRATLGACALSALLLASHGQLSAQDLERGKAVYDKWCAGCHGDTGAGDGDAAEFMLPRPRNFTGGVYQIRTTATGELPTDDDIRRVIDVGMPGTTMPAWEDRLSSGERNDLVAYLKSFSRFFEGENPQPIDVGRKPGRPSADELADAGRLFVDELQCLRCHGDQGRGDGTSAPELTDDFDVPIRAADLTRNWTFNGGGTVEDIYMRLRTGLDGTPMPSNSDVVDAGIITDEQLWRVAQYVRSLSPDKPPRRSDVVRAAFTEGALPTAPADSLWEDIEAFYIPMVGQITLKPRWFSPTVDGIWVRAMHDGERLAVKLAWSDASASPDSVWEPFFQGVLTSMAAPDRPHVSEQGPDRIALQFPLVLPEGTELPYFLGGDARRPVYMIRWVSMPDRVQEGTATGAGTFAPLSSSDVQHAAAFRDGQWQVQFTRALAPRDSSVATTFVLGQPIPMALSAADGTNAEDEMRGSVSAWYAIYLDAPIPTRVYVAPVVATLLTAGLGMLVVWQAQRRERHT